MNKDGSDSSAGPERKRGLYALFFSKGKRNDVATTLKKFGLEKVFFAEKTFIAAPEMDLYECA